MARKHVILGLILVTLTTPITGCLSEQPGGSGSEGNLHTEVVTEVPENATVVDYSDVEDTDAEILRSALEDAVANGSSWKRLASVEVERVKKTLSNVPQYTGPEKAGRYVRYEGEVVRVRLILDSA